MANPSPTAQRPATSKDATPPAPASKPLAVFKFESVSAAVFPESVETERGPVTLFNVSVRRSFKTKGGQWQHGHTLHTGDLLPAALALMKAYEFVQDTQAKPGSVA